MAPGEILSVFGSGLGPRSGLTGQPDGNGAYATQLGNTSILIGSTAHPLLYASDTQVNAIVLYSLASGPSAAATTLTVQNGSFSASYAVRRPKTNSQWVRQS